MYTCRPIHAEHKECINYLVDMHIHIPDPYLLWHACMLCTCTRLFHATYILISPCTYTWTTWKHGVSCGSKQDCQLHARRPRLTKVTVLACSFASGCVAASPRIAAAASCGRSRRLPPRIATICHKKTVPDKNSQQRRQSLMPSGKKNAQEHVRQPDKNS